MTIAQLRYILAVDSYKHFAKAAEACYVTQPTLSMQIKKLEEDLDVVIFDRSKQPIVTTVLGAQIVEQAQQALHEFEKIEALVETAKGKIAGPFRMAIIPTVASTLLPRMLARFNREYPDVELIIEELQTQEILRRLRKDRIDAAIMATPSGNNQVIEKPLYYEPFMAFVPENHRLAEDALLLQSDLEVDDILLLKEGHCFRNSVLQICELNNNPEVKRSLALDSGNFETLIKLARQGFGMTLIPYLKATELKGPKDRARVKPFAAPKPLREISMVYSRAQLKLPIINAMIKVIQKSIPEKLLQQDSEGFVSPIVPPQGD